MPVELRCPPPREQLGLGPRLEHEARRTVEGSRDHELTLGFPLHRRAVLRGNGFEDDDGCPDRGPNNIHTGTGHEIIVTPLSFDRGLAAPKAGTESALIDLASAIDRTPQLLLIEIQGHASADEPRAKALSMARAVAVRNVLIKRGVSADRLVARGYGATLPVVCPKNNIGCETSEVRRMNRRVELKAPQMG
jgi:outer membrane protein OmpA-like peptidoglycan-associated protein